MNDIFKYMQAKVGCEYLSDLPSYKRKVWHEMKRLNPADYAETVRKIFKICVWYVIPDLKRCDETTERT